MGQPKLVGRLSRSARRRHSPVTNDQIGEKNHKEEQDVNELMMSPWPNHAMQPTAGRCTASLPFMKTRSLQATLALASGG
jgi:hypothetical protein